MEKNESIIGKEYRALDNSYAVNLTEEGKPSRLSGIYNHTSEISTIVTEPFICYFMRCDGVKVNKQMVIVKDGKNNFHSVMYFKEGLITPKQL